MLIESVDKRRIQLSSVLSADVRFCGLRFHLPAVFTRIIDNPPHIHRPSYPAKDPHNFDTLLIYFLKFLRNSGHFPIDVSLAQKEALPVSYRVQITVRFIKKLKARRRMKV